MRSEPQTRRGAGRGIAGALRAEFADEDIRLGDLHARTVEGTVDPLGGAVASVRGLGQVRRVRLMPSLTDDGVLLAACECSAPDAPGCEHLWAVLQAIEASDAWPRGTVMPSSLTMTDLEDPDLELIAEHTGTSVSGVRIPDMPGRARPNSVASAMRGSASRMAWRDLIRAWPRAPQPPSGKLARIEYVLEAIPVAIAASDEERRALIDDRACTVLVSSVTNARGGGVHRKYGRIDPARLPAEDLATRGVLFGVEEIDLEPGRRAARSRQQVAARIAAARTAEILARLAAGGRFGWLPDPGGPLAPLAWDADGAWSLEVTIAAVPEHRVARVTGELVRGDVRQPVSAVEAVAGGGIAVAAGRALEVAVDGLVPWMCLLRQEVTLALWEVPSFIERTCSTRRPPRLELGEVGIDVAEREPVCRIVIAPQRRAGFSASAELLYDGRPVDLSGPTMLVRARGKQIVRRRLDDEHAWALAVRELGGSLEADWSVAPGALRALVEAATARRMEVFYAGGKLRLGGEFSASVESGIDWFDLSLGVDAAGAALDMPELLAALRTGCPLVRLSDGTTLMIPAWLERRAAALAAAPLEGNALRFRKSETLILSALLDGIPEVDVDARFSKLRDRLEGFVGMTPSDAPRGFGATLRDYQRDGFGWLRFLHELGLGGCLADDMGLGKTVQVLALLEHARGRRTRHRGGVPHKPSLVVAPKSLVFHWLDEARRFAPRLAMLEWHGLARSDRAAELATADVIVTTYATLRLDLERLAAIDYATVVLDEAHAIKNAATATASAARALRADFRLALTGTPVENRLDDLASIFDYLNPGLLGRTAVLRAIGDASAEPASDGGSPAQDPRRGELAQARALGKVLQPFMMRRTKQQVLTELPAKTEVELTCRLEGDERRRYDELRDHYRRSLLPAVERNGIQRNAIIVLEALLRLRQAALHPGLLDAGLATADSAKLDALVEHLREASASGHRALVFSQFTKMLGIVGSRLQREGIAYEYLDGATRDRRERVAAFQQGAAPVFLISLKAGGVGLNLTAADHVFLFDPWWNPAVEAQAIDRVHRIGQCRPVTAYRLVAENTVEAKILALQAHKRALFDSVFEDTGIVASLSSADLHALLE
jgi:superfamily II DNA or RNA helicase